MKRTILFLLAATTVMSCLYAQTTKNPFSKMGYKKHITYTSSKGEFEEFHKNADVVEIGSVYFNTKTNKVVGFVNEEKENAEVATATSAMSVDPLCEKYYWITPYAYCMNNPVKFVDPDGKAVYLFATRLPTTDGNEKSGVPFATHTFIVVRGKDNVDHYYAYGSDQGMYGPLKMYTTKDAYTQDKQVFTDQKNGKENINQKACIEMPIPEGMTSEQFDKKVISTAESFGNNPNVTYVLTGGGETGGNCNTSTSTILSKSGVDEKTLSDTKSKIPGLVWGFGNIKPWTATEQKAAVQKENKILEEANKSIK
ncbi:MAG: hypothetical protein Q8904_00695 [Bacteroidota bacterium]|nr:hypothetical protein [Bacteroidota bacterium]